MKTSWFCGPLVLTLALASCLVCNDDTVTRVNGLPAHVFLGRGEYLGEYWPTDEWRTCRPEAVGMSSKGLIRVYDFAADSACNTEGLVIVKDGYIVGEAYFRGFGPDDRHYSYSVAKSFTSAVIGIAIDQGLIADVNQEVYQYYPQWQHPDTDARKQQITIRNLLTMTSGIQWNEDDYYVDPEDNDAYIMHRQRDMIRYVLDKPMRYAPGQEWYYSTGDSQLLSGVIEGAVGTSFYQYALPNLLQPIGLQDILWDRDAAGHTHTGSGIRATVREYAKFGYLYLNQGRWENKQIVPQDWVDVSVQPASAHITWYGYQWWLKPALTEQEEPIIPDGTFLAWGIYTQQIFVLPEVGIVIARVGDDSDASNNGWDEVAFLKLVMESVH